MIRERCMLAHAMPRLGSSPGAARRRLDSTGLTFVSVGRPIIWMTDYSSSDQDIVFTHDDTLSHLVACSEPTSPPCFDPARSFRRQTLPPFSPSQISYIGTSAPGTPFHPPRRGLSRNFRSPSASPSHESLMSRTGSESVECSIQSQLGREVDAVGHGQTGEWSGARR